MPSRHEDSPTRQYALYQGPHTTRYSHTADAAPREDCVTNAEIETNLMSHPPVSRHDFDASTKGPGTERWVALIGGP